MIVVLKPGLLATVQDLGRAGHRERGICPGGALDTLALTLANRLVGNPDGAAGLELTMGGCELRFETDTRIALAGDRADILFREARFEFLHDIQRAAMGTF